MLLREIDFLSPPISLFYQGFPSNSSIGSGILSILTILLIVIYSVMQLKDLFSRVNNTLSSKSFTYFIDDAGTIPLNASSLFHFISIKDFNNKGREEFDFTYFNAVGFKNIISEIESNTNINNFNHWLYGSCNEKDVDGIEDIIPNNSTTKSACIRKYFDSDTQSYYDTNDPNFKWPNLSHGIFHPDNNYYSIIISKCRQNILDIVFNGDLSCKSVDNLDMTLMSVHLNFIDQYIDLLNYENPVTKFHFQISNKLDKDNYSLNNLNFNPSLIRTNNGYMTDNIVNEISFFYERNEALTYQRKGDLYMAYSLYLNNRLTFYERSYQTIQDFLSSLGGFFNIIIFVMKLINELINSSMMLFDFNFLLNLFSINIKDIKKSNQKNIIDIKIKEVEEIKKNIIKSKKTNTRESIVNEIENYNRKETEDKEIIKVIPINSEKSKIKENADVSRPKNSNNNELLKEIEEVDEEKEKSKDVFEYCDFFLYKITCGKKKKELEIYEDLMKKIISVENLMHTYLKMNNLLKSENENDMNEWKKRNVD